MLFHIHEKVKLHLFLQVYNIKLAKQTALRFTNQTKMTALKKKEGDQSEKNVAAVQFMHSV